MRNLLIQRHRKIFRSTDISPKLVSVRPLSMCVFDVSIVIIGTIAGYSNESIITIFRRLSLKRKAIKENA